MVPEIGVIGGEGFIGKNLVKTLKGDGITKETEDSKRLNHYKVLINANGNSRKGLPEVDPLADFDLTVRNTLKSVTSYSYDTYIYISSCEVYTGGTHEGADLHVPSMSRYGLSKYLAECVVRKYCSRWLILRLNGPVGPGMKKGPAYDILRGDKLWINAESRFQFLHTNYIGEFVARALKEKWHNEVFNLTGPDAVSMFDAMTVLRKTVGYSDDPPIIHRIDVTKANKLLLLPSSRDSLSQARRDYEAEFGVRY